MPKTKKAPTPAAAVSILRDEISNYDDSFYLDYSGRGMFGKRCVGIVTAEPSRIIEEAAARGIRGARTDSMGRSTIVYWPDISAPADDDADQTDEDAEAAAQIAETPALPKYRAPERETLDEMHAPYGRYLLVRETVFSYAEPQVLFLVIRRYDKSDMERVTPFWGEENARAHWAQLKAANAPIVEIPVKPLRSDWVVISEDRMADFRAAALRAYERGASADGHALSAAGAMETGAELRRGNLARLLWLMRRHLPRHVDNHPAR